MPIYQFVVHICLMKTRRDGTVICSSRILNRVDAITIPLTFMSW